jgi:hypothetical protein
VNALRDTAARPRAKIVPHRVPNFWAVGSALEDSAARLIIRIADLFPVVAQPGIAALTRRTVRPSALQW